MLRMERAWAFPRFSRRVRWVRRPRAFGCAGLLGSLSLFSLQPNLFAQSVPAVHPEFEVASIKPSQPGARPGGTFIPPGGERYTGSNVFLKFLIQDAYRMHRDQITGGPNWIASDLYNLNAKAERPSSLEDMRLMLQNLIVDRFKLRFHYETVTGPVYALAVDRSSALKLRRHDGRYASEPFMWQRTGPGQELKIGWHASSASMDYLAWQLSSVMYLPVIDRTGLEGAYDFDLAFTRELPLGLPEGALINGVAVDTTGPTVFEAIRKLGLRLVRQTGPVTYMRIDSVERPSEN